MMTCRKAVVLNGISTIKAGSRHSEKKVVKCCRTGMGRSWSREEAGLDQKQGQEGQKLDKGRSRAEVRTWPE